LTKRTEESSVGVFDDETAARLRACGIDVAALLRAYTAAASPCSRPAVWEPAADLFEADDVVVIKLELAGVAVDELNLTLGENLMVVRGTRKDESPRPRSAVRHVEIQYGPFEKRLWLPWAVQPRTVRATYDRGFLFIAMQKARRPVARTVSIRVRV
jgi:HSP20 family protein